MTNIIGGLDLVENIAKMTHKDGKKEITNLKESLTYIKKVLKDDNLTSFIKVSAIHIKGKITYTIKFMGRYYLEDFNFDGKFESYTEKIVKKIKDLLKIEDSNLNKTLSRRDRRNHLKNTGYFKAKKKKSLNEWFKIIQTNNKVGKEKQGNFLSAQVTRNVEFLVDREIVYRNQLSKLNYDGKQIEAAVEKWYASVIKEDSFMSEK